MPANKLSPRDTFGYQLGLIGFTRFNCLLRQFRFLRFVNRRYLFRLLLVVATSLVMTPLCWWQTLRFGRRIARTRLAQPPVFIIGHWRSGTTHLHNLISQDTNFGCLSMYQALVPGCSLIGRRWLKPLLSRVVPLQRLMDSMTWPMDAPQEDEIALAKLIPYSFYARFLFPRQANFMLDRYVLLNGASQAMVDELERAYRRLLRVTTLQAGGRRLLLKNPVNTARIPLLLRLYPDAKFIHIYRNPYDVYSSTVNLYDRLLGVLTLQKLTYDNTGNAALQIYDRLMHQYFADKSSIPPGSLVEVCYETLEQHPEAEIKRIYETLDLPGYENAAPAVRAYLGTIRSYRKNEYRLSAEQRVRIEEHWGFAFHELGYAMEGEGGVAPAAQAPAQVIHSGA